MRSALNLELPEPEWITLLREQQAKGKSVSQIARETGMKRPSLSMLLNGTYPDTEYLYTGIDIKTKYNL